MVPYAQAPLSVYVFLIDGWQPSLFDLLLYIAMLIFAYFGTAYMALTQPLICVECYEKWTGLNQKYCDDCLDKRTREKTVGETIKR